MTAPVTGDARAILQRAIELMEGGSVFDWADAIKASSLSLFPDDNKRRLIARDTAERAVQHDLDLLRAALARLTPEMEK